MGGGWGQSWRDLFFSWNGDLNVWINGLSTDYQRVINGLSTGYQRGITGNHGACHLRKTLGLVLVESNIFNEKCANMLKTLGTNPSNAGYNYQLVYTIKYNFVRPYILNLCLYGYRRRDKRAEWVVIYYTGVMPAWEECGLGFVGLKHYLHW
jgi:hypothetical protein